MNDAVSNNTAEGRCGSCKFWTWPIMDNDFYRERPYGNCERVGDELDLAESDELATAAATNDIGAILQTKAEFGCVLWETK